MISDIVTVTRGDTYSTKEVPIGDSDAAILCVQSLHGEHGYEVSVIGDEFLLSRVLLTGTQDMIHVPFPADVTYVHVEVENLTGCAAHPHTYEISLDSYEDAPYAA